MQQQLKVWLKMAPANTITNSSCLQEGGHGMGNTGAVGQSRVGWWDDLWQL